MRRELEAVRADGHAADVGEAVANGCSLAVPVVESGGTVAALQVTGIEVGDYVARLVVRTARELSDDLAGPRD